MVTRVRLHGDQSLNVHLVQELLTHSRVVSREVHAGGNVGAVPDPLGEPEETANGGQRAPNRLIQGLVFVPNLPITESNLTGLGIQALIGRDVLSKCVLIYNGQSFFSPSPIDQA